MQKIPTLYVRDRDNPKYVTDQVTPGCEWVLAGEGAPTRKWNGTCVYLDPAGKWWARREVKPGKQPPPNYRPISTDEVTGKTVGWEPIEQSPFARWHAEAVAPYSPIKPLDAGTYELLGPKINGNPEGWITHGLAQHGSWPVGSAKNSPHALIYICRDMCWEGIVWHHPDGRMAKLKVRDYPQPKETT